MQTPHWHERPARQLNEWQLGEAGEIMKANSLFGLLGETFVRDCFVWNSCSLIKFTNSLHLICGRQHRGLWNNKTIKRFVRMTGQTVSLVWGCIRVRHCYQWYQCDINISHHSRLSLWCWGLARTDHWMRDFSQAELKVKESPATILILSSQL